MTTMKQARPFISVLILGVVIVALLAASVAGIVIHHRSATDAAALTPAGYQRVIDRPDGLRLAVPASWQVLPLTSGQLASEFQALAAQHPQLAPLLRLALSDLRQVRPGAFAFDAASRTTFFAFGAAAPGIASLADIHTSDIVSSLAGAGARNVHTTVVHLRVGDAERVSLQLPLGTATVSELVDYLVLHGRVVAIILASPANQPSTPLFHKIEATLATTS
jgi:hypothetical protein